MLIPSIDLKGGQVVQLVQGRDLALASDDVFAWVRRFAAFPKVQLIDLDAAMGSGRNDQLVRRVCAALPCRVGGGIRSIERAQEVLASGAAAIIVGSALFRDGCPDLAFCERLAAAVGRDRVVAAVDSLGGKVVVRGWTEATPLSTVDAVRALEPYCDEFLYTHVDTEGLMQGIDMAAVHAVRQATTRRVTAAGGITTADEIAALDRMAVDAVVGMAIYTGRLALDPPPRP
jgi:phosphoribosylformimino-5-aminoimidazole carboxamide ribotide isomerase